MESCHKVVSFDDELLIRVDKYDNVLGYSNKYDVHAGKGVMHRAFSVFIVSFDGEVLLQKRCKDKQLWPCFWSNSCCSHPRKGETYLEAAHRRLNDELGIDAHLDFIYKFDYTASFDQTAAENELCAVFVGFIDNKTKFQINKNEIETIEWVKYNEIDQKIVNDRTQFTPWFLMEWEHLKNIDMFNMYKDENSSSKAVGVC